MSLGSIAHLQYYFARTGLLDGKGGHAREWKKKIQKPENLPRLLLTPNARYIDDDENGDDTESQGALTESPTEELLDDEYEDADEVMLPPTVSTYSIKTHHIPPPPDLMALRKDLLDALARVETALDLKENSTQDSPSTLPSRPRLSPDNIPDSEVEPSRRSPQSLPPTMLSSPQGWHEIRGMQILDVVTLAIRAAKIYYTAHERPERLAAIRSEREIRQELFHVLDVLKRWASRNFTGGLRDDERSSILSWMASVRALLAQEAQLEEADAKERESWIWADGDWTGRERERELLFLRSLTVPSDNAATWPSWTAVGDGDESPAMPTPLLERLRDGRELVRMHNQAVRKSKRPFGEIRSFHEDVGKPYRRAENLRYWLKAAEIRWELKLELDVMGVVYGSSSSAWRSFDAALLAWCRAVRSELARDWRGT